MIDPTGFVRETEDGAWRVGGTRVLIELIAAAFSRGASAEEIAEDYASLTVAQVEGAIAFYQKNRDEVDRRIAEQERLFEEGLRRQEENPDAVTLRIRAALDARTKRA